MHKTKIHIIRIITLLLLLAGGVSNVAWAKVTYHILTKPFTVKTYNGDGDYRTNIRVEALQCTSEEATVGLPDQFQSPLVASYQYWTTAASTYESLYDYDHSGTKIINTKYYIYTGVSNEITAGSAVGENTTDIYVTYTYNSSNGILDLTGGTNYNVAITSGGKEKFMCYNRSRNNRVANALSSGLSGEDLASDDFVIPVNDKKQLGWNWSKWGPIGLFSGFKFTGEDPYNITIMTSYVGPELHITDAITNVDNTGTVKPYAESTLMAKVNATSLWFDASNNKHYKIKSGIKDAGQWTQAKYDECWNKYYVTEKDAQYDTWNGFYRYESPTMNAFALLNNTNGGYMFVGSKMNQNKTQYQPNGSGQYYSYYDNYDNDNGGRSQPYFKLQALNAALPINFYKIRTYTVHVKTHGSNTPLSATMKWSDARRDDAIVNHIPDVLRRKYVNYTAYSDEELENEITSFAQATSGEIWLDYTVSNNIPFKILPKNGSYQDAQWYTMRMDGVANPKYIAYEGASNALVVTDGSGNPKGSNTASQVHQGENSAEAMVAFMGDPYELRVISRSASEAATTSAGVPATASHNRYIGCASASGDGTGLSTNMTGSSDISTWEIVYESTGETGMLLRQFNTASSTPKYIGLGVAANDKPVTYSEKESRIRVVELEQVKYTYHIVRNNEGDIAVKASDTHDVGKMLRFWTDIPDVIRSPFLNRTLYPSATVAYYGSLADAKAETNAISNAPYDSNRDIYVRYSVSITPSTYNVRLNNDYIYTDETDIICNKPMLDEGDAGTGAFQWYLDYSDPYHMTIRNSGKGKYVNVAFSDDASISWSDTPSYFVAKSGSIAGTYEIMAATGDGTDASVTYYNIGRPSANTVKLYSNSSYQYGNAVLRFQLIGTSAVRVVYHLIDKKGKDLLQATTRQITTSAPSFPPEYHSPLVSSYYYYAESAFSIVDGTYTLNPSATKLQSVTGVSDVFVTYDVNDLVDLKAGQLYLLKYEAGEEFYQEDGSDGFTNTKKKAIYPYCNGDGNFFVYGQEQYDIQQEGASSTRTRWAWYVESNVEGAPKGDPYHVMIKSRQTESYPITNSSEYNAYFMTYQPDGYDKVITTLGWPGMNSEAATEYMVLGSEGQYQLVTTNEIGGSRYVVNSFEQYWKTWDTIRKKVYGESSAKENDSDPIIIPDDTKYPYENPTAETLRHYLENTLKWHHYEKWAYAKRWNGYNNGYSSTEGKHETKKGWERVEHWYQTIDMGQGYFDFVKTEINPVLILLDQHGWEIMRKPLPTSPDDPNKETKYSAIRPYNSSMVKEYAFWATAKKRTGFHQYYAMADRIGGDDYTSTDLTSLPPYNSKNVKDKKGNLNDQYVTYIVKDEYAQTYTPSTKTGKEFLIEQGDHKYATTNAGGTTLIASDIPYSGDMMAHILNDNIYDTEKWYVKPNANIDIEMGYNDAAHTWTDPDEKDAKKWKNKNPNAYDHYKFKDNLVATYLSTSTHAKELIDSLGYFSFSNGFDPYNIQISSVQASSKYMKTNANGATLEEGSLVGSYPAVPGTIAMDDNTTTITPAPKWYDSRNLAVTNATYMAVQDADGNMQLMPRFDHTTRMGEFATLIAPTDNDVAKTYTKLYRPEVYEYLIIDNDGKESLRYKTGGDLKPQTPDHFQSPLATNFTYYATATYDSETSTYSNIEDEIKESFDGVTLTGNTIYVRYEYDGESDGMNMLKGNWLTMQLNEKDAVYDSGIKQASEGKPETIDEGYKQWQWKFTETSQPDPYAIYIYNRNQSAGTKAMEHRFALLPHSEGYYALAKAGVGTYTYSFLNGNDMSTSTPADVDVESGFTPTSGTFDGKKSQVVFNDDVTHSFVYKVYTNGGIEALSASQSQEDVISNDWKPVLPEAARTPLLNMDQYRYYEHSLAGEVAQNDTLNKSLSHMYGLYNDNIYTHYTAYDANVSTYVVPNVRNATNVDPVARGDGSNDAQIGLDGKRPYNIIWYADNMMKSNGTSISSDADKELQATAAYEWEFEGDDPYAIKIKSVGEANKYIHEATTTTTELSTTATTFMLLDKDGYDYGVFAKTGDATTMLSGYGNALTTSDPTKFIPFALSTYKVIYHLIIANIGNTVSIPYAELDGNGNRVAKDDKVIDGSTMRDLTSRDPSEGTHYDGDKYQLGSTLQGSTYCIDAGHVSLGDAFEIPQLFYRPNVSYDYYIGGVYDKSWNDDATMNSEYKGLKMTNMGEDTRLLDKIVWVNVVYHFLGGLDTNSGSDFVTGVNQNKWYAFETSDATPMLAEYSGVLKTVSGYATHYTNDYLWTPVGDPYGFKMYNRYSCKNLGQNKVMSTSDFTTDRAVEMVNDNAENPYVPHLPANSVYELLANSSTTPGYFRVHPVVNMRDNTQYYIKNNSSTGAMTLSTTPTEWGFGLSEELMRPYYQAAGYIGGLNSAGKTAYEAALNVEGDLAKLMALQDVVYNHDNDDSDPSHPNFIVHYTPGYYRLHSQPGSSGITTPRYMSGYTHKIELTAGNESTAIPLHFYEVEEYNINNPTFKDIGTAGIDYTETAATRGDIPLVTVDKDPASIFRFTGTASEVKLGTQGLYVMENKMTETESSATPFKIVDIGAGIVALQGGVNFLKYDQTSMKYDLKFDNTASTVESARWCMQPVQKSSTANDGEMALKVKTNYGGDEHYYTTFFAPFDVLLTSTNDEAYIVPTGQWPAMTTDKTQYVLYPKKIGDVNTGTYANNSQFIPAGTPVIIRTKNTGGEVTMVLPTATPSAFITTDLSGEYLEQMLLPQNNELVFVFGRSYTHSDEFTYNEGTGIVTPAGLEVDKGVGFYKNASNDRESNATKTMWTRNNKYVYGNKIYYRAAISDPAPSPAREVTRSIEFVPVIFDDEDSEEPDIEHVANGRSYPLGVYDLLGRCVATEEEVKDGSWRQHVAPGVYIVHGKKVMR